jgi:hypothetical protein
VSAGVWILIALLAFAVLALFIFGSSNADLAERLRKASARADYLRRRWDDDKAAGRMWLGKCVEQQFRIAQLEHRIAELEARELPWLDEIRASNPDMYRAAAAHGSQWGPS